MTTLTDQPARRTLPLKRSRRTLTAVVIGAVVVLLVLGLLIARSGADQAPAAVAGPAWFEVRRQTFDLTVTATGELVARDNIEIKNRVEGSSTIVEVIPEGTRVEKGDLLIKLNDESIRDKIQQEELNVESARAQFVSAQENLAIQESEAESKRRNAEVALAMAELELAKWTSGDDPQRQQELQLALEKATRALERAKRDLELSEQLFAQKFISQNEYEDDQIALIESQSALATAQLNKAVYENYTRPKEKRRVELDVEQAKAELDRTLRRNAVALEAARVDLESKKRSLELREERLAKLREQLELTRITAPADGLVVYATSAGPRRGRAEPIVQGRNTHFNETLMYLPDTTQMVAEIKVHEALLPQVKIGQPVNVSIDSRPDAIIRGSVMSIAVMAEDGGWLNPDLREYKVRVELPRDLDERGLGGLKPGMRCSGQIIVGHVENALAVPVHAVYVRGRQQYVYVPAGLGGRVRPHPVTVGHSSEALAEIVEGLEPGDSVLLRRPSPGEIVGQLPGVDEPSEDAPPDAPPEAAPQAAPGSPATATVTPPTAASAAPAADKATPTGDRPRRRQAAQ